MLKRAARTHGQSLVHRTPLRKGLAILGVVALLGVHPRAAAAGPPTPDDLMGAVQKHLHVFLTLPERREEGEGVSLDDHGELEVRFLRTLDGAKREAWLCQAMRWLLLGRLSQARGVRGLFEAIPEAESVVLTLYELQTELRADAEGRYRQSRSAAPRARLRLTRARGLALDREAVARELAPGQCVERGRSLLDAVWVPEPAPPVVR